jgi:RND family efflux transporter MFP subunit
MNNILRLRIAGILLAAGMLAACSASNAARSDGAPAAQPSEAASLAVTVESGRQENISRTITATGSVAAWQELVIGAETNGVAVADVLVDEGARVKKGDVLARLDDSLLRAQVAQQQAAIAEAGANLESAQAAEARGAKLVESSNVSKESQETRVTARKTAEAKLDAARAALDLLQVQLDKTRIVAPADGIVSKRSAVVGTVVQTGTELFRIIRDGKLEVAAKVAEQYLGDVQTGATVAVTDAASHGATGRVRTVAPTVDESTRLGTVYVSLDEGSGLRPGMSARVSIAGEAETAFTVPENALVWRNGQAAVFTVGTDDKVALKDVTVGARAGGRAAVAGIDADDRIVTAGAGFLNAGDKVRVVVADAATGAGR